MNMTKRAGLIGAILAGLGCVPVVSATPPSPVSAVPQPPVLRDFTSETTSERDARIQWWRDAAFGMFVHWGPYAVPAGAYRGKAYTQPGEWLQAWANIPRNEYVKYTEQFTANNYNPDEWARIAKDTGMRYLVITAKHHDGFSIYDSKATDFDMVDSSPYKRDALAPLAEACKRHGVKLGIYYSILDWHHPSQFPDPAGKDATNGHNKTKMRDGRKDEYATFMKVQLEELIRHYDPEILWFDGAWTEWWTEADGKDLYNYIRSFKPSLLVNNRIGKGRGSAGLTMEGGYVGDFGTPEQKVPPTGLPGVDWESCMTMNETWGYKTSDEKWKSSKELVQHLVDIASKRGNYLLNVGPTADGTIPGASVSRLREIATWMKVNGEAIYATGASPFADPLAWGRVTTKMASGSAAGTMQTKLFLHVFQWPADGKLSVPKLNNVVKRAYLMADPDHKQLTIGSEQQRWVIQLPGEAPDELVSVVALEVEGHPKQLKQVAPRVADENRPPRQVSP